MYKVGVGDAQFVHMYLISSSVAFGMYPKSRDNRNRLSRRQQKKSSDYVATSIKGGTAYYHNTWLPPVCLLCFVLFDFLTLLIFVSLY